MRREGGRGVGAEGPLSLSLSPYRDTTKLRGHPKDLATKQCLEMGTVAWERDPGYGNNAEYEGP